MKYDGLLRRTMNFKLITVKKLIFYSYQYADRAKTIAKIAQL